MSRSFHKKVKKGEKMEFRLKKLRKERKISQLKLAIDLNVNQNTISRYENLEREADYENEGEEGRICSACGYKDTRPMPIKEKNDDGTTRDDDIVVKIDDPVYLSLIPVALALIGIIVVTVRKKKNSK